ncbi:hypothetical protein HPB50_026449 [Hyalomma asiaticum]|uniref:Uncharacterized protein n=1 Tax=Hyalomma asiaticum TaxID=266040 RepID=A0ACB7SZY9_HYAAI|nr:hypothetical protein HPB50_026449 [Hyalomma asiaticum]
MERRPFKKKRKTAEQFGARKRKSPAAKKFSPATSHTDSAGSVQDDADSQPSTSSAHGTSSASINETVHAALEQCFVPAEASSTIRARLEPRFVSADASRERATAVQESLSAVSATERKLTLMGQGESGATTEAEEEFFLVQRAALNGLLGSALCQYCKQPVADPASPAHDPMVEGYRNKDEFSIRQGPSGEPKTVGFLVGSSAGKGGMEDVVAAKSH